MGKIKLNLGNNIADIICLEDNNKYWLTSHFPLYNAKSITK